MLPISTQITEEKAIFTVPVSQTVSYPTGNLTGNAALTEKTTDLKEKERKNSKKFVKEDKNNA